MKAHRKGKAIEFQFGSTTRDQACVTKLFAALLGKPDPVTCPTCGGIAKTERGLVVPTRARCTCAATRSDEE